MFTRPHANSGVPGNTHLRERKPRAAGPNPSLRLKDFPEEISAHLHGHEKTNPERVPEQPGSEGRRGLRAGKFGDTSRAAAGKAAAVPGRRQGPRRAERPPPSPPRPPAAGRPGERPPVVPLPRGRRPPPGPGDGGGRVASLPRYLPQQETTRSKSCADLQAGEPSALPQGAITPARREATRSRTCHRRSCRRRRKRGRPRLAHRSCRLGER